ncbi:hypothetical protein [Symbioplanes lichenis]|uniref:hypothetical protein n=1 Tax=Symbioplanes lichenis TaxID=1629072 RepID=UPI002738C277|nr:hypothetical protein [Actinoplanes lichenis]
MTGDPGRPLPQFFVRWRAGWGDSAAGWTPTDYLNQDTAVGPAIAAGWLFNPPTVRYRGGLFLADRFSAPAVDEWFERYPDESARIEAVVNAVTFFDLFVNCDIDPYADALPGLAADVAACWRGVLPARHPDLTVTVEVGDAYGPSVTFWTQPHDL